MQQPQPQQPQHLSTAEQSALQARIDGLAEAMLTKTGLRDAMPLVQVELIRHIYTIAYLDGHDDARRADQQLVDQAAAKAGAKVKVRIAE